MSIAPRYEDMGHHGQRTKTESEGLSIGVRIEDRVRSLFDLNKNIGKVRTTASPAPTYTIVEYFTETAIMDEDFTVTIQSSLDYLICSRATLSPPNKYGLAALMINLKPAEVFMAGRLENFDGEIIFLLDRSGSMDWNTARNKRTKMSTLRESMPLSLASLPTTCHLNIVSFGNNAEFLWERSQPYNQNTLDDARSYVRGLEANLGGTELLHALRKVVESKRHTESSTQIVIVTDGEVALEEVLTFVWETRQKLGDSIRFFALGIGERVPHRIINRIGEFGRGYGDLMLTYGLMLKTWIREVDLGPGFTRQDLYTDGFMDKHIGTEIRDSRAACFVQAPFPTPCLHPFAFLSVFLLLDLRSRAAPTKVTLRAASHSGDIELKHELNIDTTSNDISTVKHLAVRASLLDLEAQLSRRVASRVQEYNAKMNAGSEDMVDEVELYKAEFIQGAVNDILDPEGFERHMSPRGVVMPAGLGMLHMDGMDSESEGSDNTDLQRADGLFIPNDVFRQKMSDYFSKNMTASIKRIVASTPSDTPYGSIKILWSITRIAETLMVVHLLRTYVAQRREVWRMMVYKAISAVPATLRSMNEDDVKEPRSPKKFLVASSMHSYYEKCAEFKMMTSGLQVCPFWLAEERFKKCRYCRKRGNAEGTGYGTNSGGPDGASTRLCCAKVGCSFMVEGLASFGQLWTHKVNEGHLDGTPTFAVQ
ncbi:von Willebrand domain-containing protein [Colletotrichum salicis]|uniref:von Willebrand domain-containing protein n=1 Tax=Colletotrichum salicis TaxID=1209931 RepID=A0A135T6V5_9PEZI|nr:von Willebrand domain-containing protein [Colletotrichum salicis]